MSGEAENQSWWKRALKGLWDNKIFIFGLAMTCGYVWALFGYFDFSFVKFQSLKLNEKGEVLGGVFGPLAMFWLILGFWQQGQELKAQVGELKEFVLSSRAQTRHLSEQVALEKYKQAEELMHGLTREAISTAMSIAAALTGKKEFEGKYKVRQIDNKAAAIVIGKMKSQLVLYEQGLRCSNRVQANEIGDIPWRVTEEDEAGFVAGLWKVAVEKIDEDFFLLDNLIHEIGQFELVLATADRPQLVDWHNVLMQLEEVTEVAHRLKKEIASYLNRVDRLMNG